MPPLNSLLGLGNSGTAVQGNQEDYRPMSKPIRGGDGPDLKVVDEAYGDFADLYSDVLRVSVVATQEHIQLAYFDRRSELFTLLAKLDSKQDTKLDEDAAAERYRIERKMDAVVLAVRILGDSDLRLSYDQIRQQRLLNRRRAAHGQLPGHEPDDDRYGATLDSVPHTHADEATPQRRKKSKDKSRKSKRKEKEDSRHSRDPSSTTDDPNYNKKKDKRMSLSLGRKSHKKDKKGSVPTEDTKAPKEYSDHRGSASKSSSEKDRQGRLEMDRSKETLDTEHMTDDDDESVKPRRRRADNDEYRQDMEAQDVEEGCGGTCLTATPDRDEQKSDILSCITNSRVLRNISDELSGACEDTLMSVDQVFNAFTLTEKDIRAVTKRIDRAKRQLDS